MEKVARSSLNTTIIRRPAFESCDPAIHATL